MSVTVEDIPLITKKSSRSRTLFSSVGQYVGVPVDRMNSFSLGLPLKILCLLVLLNVSPLLYFDAVITSGYKFWS